MTPLLRPLSLGEMLDRAFVLAMRTLLPVCAVAAPVAAAALLVAFLAELAVTKAHLPNWLGVGLTILGLFAFFILAAAAEFEAQLDAYLGRRVRISTMLASARRRWPQLRCWACCPR